jgi:hypothetical protein
MGGGLIRLAAVASGIAWAAGGAASAWGVKAFPTNFFIDAQGIVRARGYSLNEEFTSLIKEALQVPPQKS